MVYLARVPGKLPRQWESLCAWGLLLRALVERGIALPADSPAGLKAAAVRGPHGKPSLPGSGVEFSISHSRGLAACAVEDVPVGVDVERVRAFNPTLIRRICAPGEEALTKEDDSLLTQLWTCKESHMKLTGQGFSQGVAETAFRELGERPRLAEEAPGGPGFTCSPYFNSISLTLDGQPFWLTECCQEKRELTVQWVEYGDWECP